MKSLIVVCDLDSIVVNLLQPWLDWYNENWNDKLTLADVTHYHIEELVKPECGMKIFDFFHSKTYQTLPALPGAVDGLRTLVNAGHDVVLASAVAGETAGEKFVWCREHLPFINRKNIFLGARKELLCCDVFIDDAPDNIQKHRDRWKTQTSIMTIGYPYNEHMKPHVDIHASSFNDTKKAWETITYGIKVLSEL